MSHSNYFDITSYLQEALALSLKSERRLFFNKVYRHREAYISFTGCSSVFHKTFQTIASVKWTRSVKNDGEGNIKIFNSPILLQVVHHLFSTMRQFSQQMSSPFQPLLAENVVCVSTCLVAGSVIYQNLRYCLHDNREGNICEGTWFLCCRTYTLFICCFVSFKLHYETAPLKAQTTVNFSGIYVCLLDTVNSMNP